jgi:hypothetical protein
MDTGVDVDINTDTDIDMDIRNTDVDVDVDVEGVKAEGGEEIVTEIEMHGNVGEEDRDEGMRIGGNWIYMYV